MSIAAYGPKSVSYTLFHRILNALKKSSGVSGYRLAEDSGLNRAYVSRLLKGENDNPSFKTVSKLCLAFFKAGAARHELDGLLISAGYSPVYELTEKDVPILLGSAVSDSSKPVKG